MPSPMVHTAINLFGCCGGPDEGSESSVWWEIRAGHDRHFTKGSCKSGLQGNLNQFAGTLPQPGFNGFPAPGRKMAGFVPGQGEIKHPAQFLTLSRTVLIRLTSPSHSMESRLLPVIML